MINNLNEVSKVALFTDIHWGVSRDSIEYLTRTMEYIDFLISDLKSKNIKDVIFLGDWFNHRNTVNVNTFNYAYDAIKKLDNYFKNVYLIIGNHDIYYKNKTEVHSIKSYEQFDNIHIISEQTEININGQKCLLAPWASDLSVYKDNVFDYLLGHLEPGDFDNGSLGKEMCRVANNVVLGHYHTRTVTEYPYGSIEFIGCPLPLNWGDCGNVKGHYIYDFSNNSRTFVENTFSPRYYKFYWSAIEHIDKRLINGNYIKIVIDSQYNYKDVMECINKLSTLNPISIDPEFAFTLNNFFKVDTEAKTKIKYSNIEYVKKYISDMDITDYADIKTTELVKAALEIYEQAKELK